MWNYFDVHKTIEVKINKMPSTGQELGVSKYLGEVYGTASLRQKYL